MFRKGMQVKIAAAVVACVLGGAAQAQVATGDTSQKKIALSNSFAGNAWRQSMLKSWNAVSQQAVADKKVAAAPAFTTAENQVTEQAQQIQNLILRQDIDQSLRHRRQLAQA